MDYITIAASALLAFIGAIAVRICRSKKPLLVLMFLIYGAAVLYLTLLSRVPEINYNLDIVWFRAARDAIDIDGGLIVLLKTVIKEGIESGLDRIHLESLVHLDGVILNVLLFIPLGYLLPAMFRGVNRWWKMLLLGLVVSGLIEAAQGYFHLGWVEPDDLMNNTLGAVIGYMIWAAFLKKRITYRF